MSHRLHAANLREVAAKAGDTTDYQIAKRSGISRPTLSRLVNGHVEPSITNLLKLSRCYGMTVESLIRTVDAEVLLAA